MLNTYNYQKANAQTLINRDKVNLAGQGAVASASVRLFNSIQNRRPEVQLMALASAFVLILEASGYDAQDALIAVSNLMKDRSNPTGREARFDALKFHMKEELIHAQR